MAVDRVGLMCTVVDTRSFAVLLYANNLPNKVRCGIQMFADDTKLWATVQDKKDQKKLQKDIDSLEEWSKTWLLKFNCKKCKVMHIWHNIQTWYQMTNNGKAYTFTKTQEEKDLGVYITNDLKWNSHCVTLRSLTRCYPSLIPSYVILHTYFCVSGTVPTPTHCTASTGVGHGPIRCHISFP